MNNRKSSTPSISEGGRTDLPELILINTQFAVVDSHFLSVRYQLWNI